MAKSARFNECWFSKSNQHGFIRWRATINCKQQLAWSKSACITRNASISSAIYCGKLAIAFRKIAFGSGGACPSAGVCFFGAVLVFAGKIAVRVRLAFVFVWKCHGMVRNFIVGDWV